MQITADLRMEQWGETGAAGAVLLQIQECGMGELWMPLLTSPKGLGNRMRRRRCMDRSLASVSGRVTNLKAT